MFEGLRVEVRVNKAKALIEAWAADALVGATSGAASSAGLGGAKGARAGGESA